MVYKRIWPWTCLLRLWCGRDLDFQVEVLLLVYTRTAWTLQIWQSPKSLSSLFSGDATLWPCWLQLRAQRRRQDQKKTERGVLDQVRGQICPSSCPIFQSLLLERASIVSSFHPGFGFGFFLNEGGIEMCEGNQARTNTAEERRRILRGAKGRERRSGA